MTKSYIQRWQRSPLCRTIAGFITGVLIATLNVTAAPFPLGKPTAYPNWWFERDVINQIPPGTSEPVWPTNYPPSNDFGAANIGQLKHIATTARDEMDARLPGSTTGAIDDLIASWQAPAPAGVIRDDFAPINVGQLKAVAKLFYDQLIAWHYVEKYPWYEGEADDFAMANLGQLKWLFSFDFTHDSDGDDLPDWWEFAAHLDPNDSADASYVSPIGTGQTFRQLFNLGTNPADANPVAPGSPAPGSAKPSLDLNIMTYAAIDVSSAYTTEDIQRVAIDQQNHVAFGYWSPTDNYASFQTGIFVDGTVSAGPSHPLREQRTVEGRLFRVSAQYFTMNAAGHLAGLYSYDGDAVYEWATNQFARVFYRTEASETEYWPDHDQLGILGLFPYSHLSFGLGALNLGNDGLLTAFGITPPFGEWSPPTYSLLLGPGSEQWFATPATGSLEPLTYTPTVFSPGGATAGFTASQSLLSPGAYAVWTGGQPTSIGAVRPLAVSDNGWVLGDASNNPNSDNCLVLTSSIGTTHLLSQLLPEKYRGKIRFPRSYDGFVNDRTDLIVSAQIYNDDPKVPLEQRWEPQIILWRNALNLEGGEPTELTTVQLPPEIGGGSQLIALVFAQASFNNDGMFCAIFDAQETDPLTGEVIGHHSAAGILLPMQFVTKGAEGQFLSQSMTWNSMSRPQIEVSSATAALVGNSIVLAASVRVTDATSDCTPTPGKQVSDLYISGAGGNALVALTNSAQADDNDPWKPYKWEAEAPINRTIPFSGPGNYSVSLRTSENAGGLSGTQEISINIVLNTLIQNFQLQLPESFNLEEKDTITATVGAGTPVSQSIILTETGNNSNEFTGDMGPLKLRLTFAEPPVTTFVNDNLTATLVKSIADHDLSEVTLSFVETGATTNTFSVVPPESPAYEIGVSNGESMDRGTFYPTIVRFPAKAGALLVASGFKVNMMDNDWAIALKTYRGEEHGYVVDDNNKPVVFNPSLCAHTDRQTKKLPAGAREFPLDIKDAGQIVGFSSIPIISGLLLSEDEDRLSKLDKYLKNFQKMRYRMATYKMMPDGSGTPRRVPVGEKYVWLYYPGQGYDYIPSKDFTKTIWTECLWRYVGSKDTVWVFDSYTQLDQDMNYRTAVCSNAWSVHDPGFGKNKTTSDQWDSFSLGPNFKKTGVTWTSALNDVFAGRLDNDGDPLYKLGCEATASCIHLLSIINATDEPRLKELIKEYYVKNAYADPVSHTFLKYTRVDRSVPEMTVGDYRADWLPGDWGYIDNITNDDFTYPATTGEHVIYLGGAFEKEDFDKFKKDAWFFGHRFENLDDDFVELLLLIQPDEVVLPRQTLEKWMTDVDKLSENVPNDVKLRTTRYGLKK